MKFTARDHVIRRETPEDGGNELVVVPDHDEQLDQHPVVGNQAAKLVARFPHRYSETYAGLLLVNPHV